MGNSQSNPTKEETRRANRLSKPLTRKLAALSSPKVACAETDGPELNTGLIGWQNPWVGSNLSTDVRNSHPKAREIPPTLFETEAHPSSEKNVVESPVQSPVVQDLEILSPISPLSRTASTSRSFRRSSYQSGSYGGSSQLSFVPPQPRRANSIQTTLTRHNSVIYEDTYEDATSSNTHFLVGNQRFSLTRRRSLLTRPGVATRRTTSAVRRVPSPIGEPTDPIDDLTDCKVLQWPLPPRQRPSLDVAPPVRPTSPPDSRYTQLGALKLGSLRVVNGSASPCPSERIPLNQPGLGLDKVDAMGRIKSTLEIPAIPDLKKSDDVPGSPFSFEKSPTITVPPPTKSIFPGESEDEGIAMFDDGTSQPDKVAGDTNLDRSTVHSDSLNKSDSGYSSAASVSSYHHSRPRASFDSQTSGSCIADGHAKNIWVTSDQSRSHYRNEEIQRYFSLHEAKFKAGNYSRLHPNFDRWYDSIGPATDQPLAALRTRRSTLCAPRYTEYPAQKIELDSVVTTAAAAIHEEQVYSRGPLYADRFSLDISRSSGSSTSLGTDTPPSYQQVGAAKVQVQMHRSASERYLDAKAKHDILTHRSRSRSRPGSRVWSQKPGIEVPPLPTILSPDHLHGEEDGIGLSVPETLRGRPRSRSQDYRRRKLTKARPQGEIHM
ncbi:uncharacterized protein N7473_000559 [Penicillium subrubescens]|uniref:Uncharacterized protein n=1 Tax=Penicillium subrubescens TaxID=1316194 RepID=A0A1Q5U7W5_9EURO|nr:uncharacterized protein N7473_000559 [Penicillium subrubescens]KAJ5911256.1 hypothetical protein N7473_000559 [Penicillium subrubescens]OKP08579.1 hypothetical protein PENSUB_5566 [Penicillium subrubescens]